MANFTTVADLKASVLFRAGEPANDSDYDSQSVVYINRSYFEAWFHRKWPWTIADTPASVNAVGANTARTVTITTGSVDATWDSTITPSVAGYKMLVGNAWYRISTHNAGQNACVLDSTFQETSVSAVACTIFQDEYTITDSDFAHIAKIFDTVDGVWLIGPVGIDDMEISSQLKNPTQGVASKFAMLTDDKFIFNVYPSDAKRYEVHYQFFPADLAVGGTPDWPRWRRYILEDGALRLLYMDKNDDKIIAAAQLWQSGLREMEAEFAEHVKPYGHSRNEQPIV